jgi:very-short-patch-repair endonuclease
VKDDYRTDSRAFAQRLRESSTDAERRLWSRLRNRRLGGFKFRRQQPLGSYVVDFVCFEQRLIVEADGGQHAEQQGYDGVRTKFLESGGYRVLRFWNNDVLTRTEAVLEAIVTALDAPPHPNPLPQGEREL